MTDKDLTPIQEALAHQEQQIADLSDVIIAQGKEIELLKRYMRKLENKIEVLEEDTASGGDEKLSVADQAARDKPPHY